LENAGSLIRLMGTVVDFPAPGGAVNTALFVFFSCSASSSRTENMGKF